MQRLLLEGCEVSERGCEVSESKVIGDHVDLTTMMELCHVPLSETEETNTIEVTQHTLQHLPGAEGSESQQANATTANNASFIRPLFENSTSFLRKLHVLSSKAP